MSQNLPKRSLWDFLSLGQPNHFVLAGANNRNVIISYRFLAAPVQANRDFLTVYFNCKYFPYYTRELLECLLGISPSGRNPYGGNKSTFLGSCPVIVKCRVTAYTGPLYTRERNPFRFVSKTVGTTCCG